jgi:hypothetical protein
VARHPTLGTEAAFNAYLVDVREQQRRKRRLISVLDKAPDGASEQVT